MLAMSKSTILLWFFTVCIISAECRSYVIRASKTARDTKTTKENIPKDERTQGKPEIYSFTVTSNIAYRYATTTVSNRVVNRANVAQEVPFTVTLPDSAFISKFLMIIGEKVYEAYVKEKDQAKKDYQQAVNRGETAGHVELSARDTNLFTVSVNVEPESKVTFNLTYEQFLPRTQSQYENVINVNPGQVVKTFQIDVNIEESAPITFLDVPKLKIGNEIDTANSKSINVKIEQPTNNTAKITWVPDDDQQEQVSADGVKGQLIVRYEIDRNSGSNQILVDEGYFVHFYAPNDLKTVNKHVLLVLDISGSMSGRKIEQLREALILILNDIREGDYFTIILFESSVQHWTLQGITEDGDVNEKLIIPANAENLAKAKEFAKSIHVRGATNIIAALRKSLTTAQWGQNKFAMKAKPLIIFLSDGEPNVEMSDTNEIVKNVTELNTDKYPIYSLALGEGADYKFLRKLSLSNSGFARNIYVASDTSLQLKNFYNELASLLLSNVSFSYVPGQIDQSTLTKSNFNSLYKGSELVVAGKLTTATRSLEGSMSGITLDGLLKVTMPPKIKINKTLGHLEKLWAYLYIKELLDNDLLSQVSNSTFKQKALDLALQYGFVTPLTSLVVIKPNETISVEAKPNSDVNVNEGTQPPHAFLMNGNWRRPMGPVMYFAGGNRRYFSRPSLTQEAIKFNQSSYLSLGSIVWLNNVTEIKFPSSNNSYSVLLDNVPNVDYQPCTVLKSNTTSHCRHLKHCVIPEILTSFNDFLPYGEGCVIDSKFVGICCPPRN